jgi:hypothetical protein
MDPYVHGILERNARAMRERGAPHARHLRDLVAERATAPRIRRIVWVRSLLGMLRGRASEGRVPASAGGRA